MNLNKTNTLDPSLGKFLNIEQFIIRVLILAGVIASSITTFLQWLTLESLEISVVIGFVAVASMSFCWLLTRFNKVVLAGILTTSILLLLMSLEVLFAQFLRQTSVATIIVLAFSNSAAYKKRTRLILHIVTFLTFTWWIIFLDERQFELPDGSSFTAMGINLLATYALLAFVTYILKKRYDKVIIQLYDALGALKETQSHLVQSEKMAALGTLSAGVGHELNNPMNFLQNGLLILKRMLDKHEKVRNEVAHVIKILDEGVKRSTSIVRSLFEFSHAPTNDYLPVSTKRIMDNCVAMAKFQLATSMEVEMEWEDESSLVNGDQGSLHQVFINVLVNAIQSMDTTGKITITQSINSTHEFIKIRDDGHGIPEEHLGKVTEPFFTTKDPGEGTGLGLSVSYNIIKEHQGSITFESKVNEGTEVTIELPLYKKPTV